MSELNKLLIAFSDDILKSAKRHLGGRTIGKNKNYGVASGQLKRSLTYRIRVRGKDIQEVTFGAKGKAQKYAAFIDKGVNGTQKDRKSPYTFRKQPSRPPSLLIGSSRKVSSSEMRRDASRNKARAISNPLRS
jgi:hypothetical protein